MIVKSTEGRCLCGAVRYRASGQAYGITHCHCKTCRRASGAPFVTWAGFDADKFTFVAFSLAIAANSFITSAIISAPKQSTYLIVPSGDPTSLKTLLSSALGVRGVVKKQRLLYRIGSTRVHLDDVDGLGFFVELEVVLNEGQASEDGKFVAEEIMKQLGICETDWVAEAYIDLIERSTK
jgi:hypothetical protein